MGVAVIPAMIDPASTTPTVYTAPANGEASAAPTGGWPGALDVSTSDLLRSLNPLHHVPVVGMIYRAVTGETIPTPLRVLGAGLIGGPVGAAGAILMSLAEELFRMGPDTSRPAAPAGMSATGSEAGVQPVTPGTMMAGDYVTLATAQPDFLRGPVQVAEGPAAYQQAETAWLQTQWLEKGLA